MITDTECQKLCHGTEWRLEHEKLLRQYGLQCQTRPAQERFKFGAGKTQEANTKALIPCVLAGQPLVLHSSELKTGIPLLGSLSLMTYLGTVIDLGKGEAYFSKLKLKAPLAKLSNGHIAVNILQVEALEETFPATFHKFHTWPLAKDELALPPDQSPRQKAVEYYRLDEDGEPGDHLTYPIEAEYGFDPQLSGSSNRFGRRAIPGTRHGPDLHSTPSGMEGVGPPNGNARNGPPAQCDSQPPFGCEFPKRQSYCLTRPGVPKEKSGTAFHPETFRSYIHRPTGANTRKCLEAGTDTEALQRV